MTDDTARLIAYHDTVCSPNCGDDISTYPTPPDDWSPDDHRPDPAAGADRTHSE